MYERPECYHLQSVGSTSTARGPRTLWNIRQARLAVVSCPRRVYADFRRLRRD